MQNTDLEMALATRWYQLKHDGRRFTHMWSFRTNVGGVHLHLFDAMLPGDSSPEWIGGYEAHYLSPPEYMKDQEPSQGHCWLLDAPCWHDGTSLWASEFWVPFWRQSPNDHVRIFDEMIRHETGRFILTEGAIDADGSTDGEAEPNRSEAGPAVNPLLRKWAKQEGYIFGD